MRKGFLMLAALVGLASSAWAAPDSGFEIRLDGGLVSPVSGLLYENYTASSSFGGSLGYSFGWFSLLLDAQYDTLNSPIEDSTTTYNTLEAALVEKFRLGALTSMKPFVFLGEGLGVSSINGSSSGSSASESDPLLEAGLGLDFFAAPNFSIFIQSKGTFLLSSTPALGQDKLAVLIPVQLGVDFVP